MTDGENVTFATGGGGGAYTVVVDSDHSLRERIAMELMRRGGFYAKHAQEVFDWIKNGTVPPDKERPKDVEP